MVNRRERYRFLSTPSARRATQHDFHVWRIHDISIHALREEGDGRSRPIRPLIIDFYPRPPRGGRQPVRQTEQQLFHFYPRPPRGGRRARLSSSLQPVANFYPRPPRGGRLFKLTEFAPLYDISIHALREEGDLRTMTLGLQLQKFLSTPSARRATSAALYFCC